MADAPFDSSQRLLAVIKTQTEIAKLGFDLGGVMALVTERAQELTGAVGAVVELAEGDDMVYRAASGIAAPQLGLRLRRQTSLSGFCVKEGRALCCNDSETDSRVDREACRRVGLRSMIVVPLVHQGATVGVLKVLSKTPKAFGDPELHTLGLMSELIAAAMFNATRYESSELLHRATHDALTGLANRALFYDRLRQSLSRAEREAASVAIVNIDMDGLKPINDVLGHRAGDAAIKEVAGRINDAARASDTVARMGGDEFALVLTPVEGRPGATVQSERISAQIGRPFAFEGKQIPLGASIGVSLYPEDARDIETLIEKADQAMYEVKRTRKTHRS